MVSLKCFFDAGFKDLFIMDAIILMMTCSSLTRQVLGGIAQRIAEFLPGWVLSHTAYPAH